MKSKFKQINIVISCSIAFIVIAASGCYYDKEDLLYKSTTAVNCTTITAKFGTDVKPIMASKCATSGCHNAAVAAGGVILETYAQVSKSAARINQRCVIDKNMPPGGALTAAEIGILKCWIESGAINN